MSISIKSRKAKGREFQKWIAIKIGKMLDIKVGKDELISSRPMGQSGVDIALIGKAKELFPFSIECKRQEKFSIPAWVKQAKKNEMDGTKWLLFCKRSNEDPIVTMDADVFFSMYSVIVENIKEIKDEG